MYKKIKIFYLYIINVGLFNTLNLLLQRIILRKKIISISVKKHKKKIHFRNIYDDFAVFTQIFINKEYEIKELPNNPTYFIDCGANIGLATLYLIQKYPETKFVCIEPEKSNFEILQLNLGDYENVFLENAALTSNCRKVSLIDGGGKAGFRIIEINNEIESVNGIDINYILEKYSIKKIDILKMDIEGAEEEVIENCDQWVEKFETLIIEIHERFKKGLTKKITDKLIQKHIVSQNGEYTIFQKRVNNKLGFVVPIKAKRLSKNWDIENILLNKTIGSMLQQTSNNFEIIIVYNDLPIVTHVSDKIKFIKSEFELTSSDKIEDYEIHIKKYYNPEYTSKMFDKSRKIFIGIDYAKKLDCNYVMPVDSDDLVSKYLIENTINNINAVGFRIECGYIYIEGNNYLELCNNIWGINGSTHIISVDYIEMNDMNSMKFNDFSLFEAHGYTYGRIKNTQKVLLEKIYKPSVIYFIHNQNYSGVKTLMTRSKLKLFIKKIVRSVTLTTEIKKEFNLA